MRVMGRSLLAKASKSCMATPPLKWVRKHPFLGLHVAYFVVLSLVGTLALWVAPKPEPLSFLDALFNAVSALTETGLPSVPMHRFSLSDQVTLLLLMVVGAQVFTSAIPLFLRRLLFTNRHQSTSQKLPITRNRMYPHCTTADHCPPNTFLSTSSPSESLGDTSLPHARHDYMENKALEDQALLLMSRLTAFYYVFSVMTGFFICQICIACSPHASAVLKKNHVNSTLFALFATVSALGNNGYILLDDNMVPLQESWVMLLCLAAVVLLGNTLYAPAMRLWLYLLHKISRGERRKVLDHMLESRQRCFTHLFPREETMWLVGTVVFLNTFQVMCMLGLDWRSNALQGLGAGHKLVAALFQSIATRAGGMNAVNLSGFSSATLFVSVTAMYIASYPINLMKEPTLDSPLKVLVSQFYKLRTKDSFLFVAMFLIFFFERESLHNDPLNFSFFNVVFEVISAYGNVGLTIGYSCNLKTIITSTSECIDNPSAFSGRWSVGGKMVLVMVMLFGRHRNLFEDCDWDITSSHDILSSS